MPRGVSTRMYPTVCEGCSRLFVATRPQAHTCSAACRQAVYRLRKRRAAARAKLNGY